MSGNPIIEHQTSKASRRILSIWLPHLSINRWQSSAPPEAQGGAVALIADSAHGPRIVAVNTAASDCGIAPATRLADARGLCPALIAVPHDADGDRGWIETLALWAQRWGPLTALDGHDAVIVDTTGAAHLFGGEAEVSANVVHELACRGFTARCGIAQTPGAAWAMSHYAAAPGIIASDGDPVDWLGPLPITALRLDEGTVLLLRRLGLKRIADLSTVDRNALARRFRNRRAADSNPLIRLDQLLGRTSQPVLPVTAVDMPLVQRRLIEPILHRPLLDQVLTDLAQDLARVLEAQRLGARRVQMRAWRVDGDRIERQIELASATREPAHILRLFMPRLDGVDAGFGIDQVQLTCPWTEPLVTKQADLADTDERGIGVRGITVHAFVDRIVARLGAGAIARPVAHPSRIPERSQPEWWREKSTVRLRDYYRIENGTGARFWIYRHGSLRDGRGGLPDWYLQGLFA